MSLGVAVNLREFQLQCEAKNEPKMGVFLEDKAWAQHVHAEKSISETVVSYSVKPCKSRHGIT